MSGCKSSPRTTALARARDSRSSPCNMPVFDLSMLEDNLCCILLLAAILVAAVIAHFVDYDVAKGYNAVAVARGWHQFFQNAFLAGVLLLGVLVTTACITCKVYKHACKRFRMILLGLFVGIAVLVGVSIYLYFHYNEDRDRVRAAFWLMLVAVVGVLVHTYICYMFHQWMGVVGMVPLIVAGLYLLWRFWDATAY